MTVTPPHHANCRCDFCRHANGRDFIGLLIIFGIVAVILSVWT